MLTGGIGRTLKSRTALYWCGFAFWMAVATPFSSWRGSSFGLLTDYLRTELDILFVVAGLTLTWKECQKLFSAGALAALTVLATSHFLQSDDIRLYGSRVALQMGTVSDPNDFAAHLMLVICFLLWVCLVSKSKFYRIVAFAGIGGGLLLIIKTGSRGAEIGLSAGLLCFFSLAKGRQRTALLLLSPIAASAILMLVPAATLQRLQSFTAAGGADGSAVESAEGRTYLLKKSIAYTFQFPIFGVGPGQFSEYEGNHNVIGGTTHGSWHDTHNSYTQASSECGIPGGALFLAGVLSTIFLFSKGLRDARRRGNSDDIQNAYLCILAGTVGFYVTIGFLNFAYLFYGPLLAGLAIAMSRAASEELRLRGLQAAERAPLPFGGRVRPMANGSANCLNRR